MHALHHVVVGREKVLCNGVLGPSTALLTYIRVLYDKAIAQEWLAVDHKRVYDLDRVPLGKTARELLLFGTLLCAVQVLRCKAYCLRHVNYLVLVLRFALLLVTKLKSLKAQS